MEKTILKYRMSRKGVKTTTSLKGMFLIECTLKLKLEEIEEHQMFVKPLCNKQSNAILSRKLLHTRVNHIEA